uniref:Uncharacterized protein n=1 Tax=Fagus sylvatica TaxID=28930 RepID=A0A2N9FX04_FAGSY
MRFLTLAVVLMMVSSCFATTRKTLVVEMYKQEKRQLNEGENVQMGYNPDDTNDHHQIPREKFDGTGNSGAGKPKP